MERARFFDAIRTLFVGGLSQQQVARIEAILDGFNTYSVSLEQRAYILATAFHESDQFRTMTEYASGEAYEGRAALGNTQKGDGKKFKGRGFVQITGRRNYSDWAVRLGAPLLKEPQKAADLYFATVILIEGMLKGTFTGKSLPDYVNAGKKDYVGARRVVNGKDKASKIAGHALRFEAALRAAETKPAAPPPEPVQPPQPVPAPEVAPKAQPAPEAVPVARKGFLDWLLGLWK